MLDVWQGSKYTSVLNTPGFLICQGSECTAFLNMLLVLNMPRIQIYQGSKYVGVTQGSKYARIIPDYAWICFSIPGYAGICVNLPKNLNLPTFPHCKPSLKEPVIVFYGGWKYLACFFGFRLNIFKSKISSLLLPFADDGRGPWILIYPINISRML